jgi:hypothetical protein
MKNMVEKRSLGLRENEQWIFPICKKAEYRRNILRCGGNTFVFLLGRQEGTRIKRNGRKHGYMIKYADKLEGTTRKKESEVEMSLYNWCSVGGAKAYV